MKAKLFHGRLYAEGLKRLRIVGIAFAILCIAVCMIVPASRWMNEARYDFYDTGVLDPVTGVIVEGSVSEHPVDAVEDGMLALPALVASYLAPLFVFFMFSYLNKRNESDFYHAIPYTRPCVYVSFVSAVLTWVWGILIVSSLSGALLWALCPYTVFSFSGLLLQMLYMCLNAALLVGVSAMAVSLMGTFGTAAVAFCLLLGSWRAVLGIGGLLLDELNPMVSFEKLLGGYLSPDFLLPLALITQEAQPQSSAILWYAAFMTVLTVVLGAWIYSRRPSETAGRAVPDRTLQIVVRCLLTLPVGLLITYLLLSGNADGSTTLILLAVMLLAFYLYELLTSKSVGSMLKATPWLGAVAGACVIFGCTVGLTNYGINHRPIKAEQIVSVGVDTTSISAQYGVSRYEMLKIREYMSKNDEAASIVAAALADTQDAVVDGNYYFDDYPSDLVKYDTEYEMTRIRLQGGRTIWRKVRYDSKAFATLMELIRKECNVSPVPQPDEIDYANLVMLGGEYSVGLSRESYTAVLQEMESEWRTLSEQDRAAFIGGSATGECYVISMRVEVGRYMTYCQYSISRTAMPRTWQALDAQAKRYRAADQNVVAELLTAAKTQEGVITYISAWPPYHDKPVSHGYYDATAWGKTYDFLLTHLDRLVTDANESVNVPTQILIRAEGKYIYIADDMKAENSYAPSDSSGTSVAMDVQTIYSNSVILWLDLSVEEQTELLRCMDYAMQIDQGLVIEEKK